MDRIRTRRPSMRPAPTAGGPTYENFQPTVEWSQDSSNNNLLIHLPGFKREEVSVQLDNNSGKIMVRGNTKVTEDKFLRLDQSFDVPENTIIEKISGRFENGYLTLILPFRKPKINDQEKSTKSDEDGMQKKPESGEKKDEAMQKEKPKGVDEKKDEPMKSDEKKRNEDDIQKKSKESSEEKKEEPIQETAQKEKKDEDTIQEQRKEQSKESIEEKKEEPMQQETAKFSEEKKDEDTIQEEKKEDEPDIDMEKKKKKEDRRKGSIEMVKRAEGMIEMMSKRVEEGVKKAKLGRRKRGPIWGNGEDGSWLEFGSIDNLLDKVNKNRKVIAVAVVAFSVGFYVSHKMKTNG